MNWFLVPSPIMSKHRTAVSTHWFQSLKMRARPTFGWIWELSFVWLFTLFTGLLKELIKRPDFYTKMFMNHIKVKVKVQPKNKRSIQDIMRGGLKVVWYLFCLFFTMVSDFVSNEQRRPRLPCSTQYQPYDK